MRLKKYNIFAVIAGVLMLQGCGDFLDSDPTEIYSEDLVWGSQETIDAFVVGNYANVYYYYYDYYTWDMLFSNNLAYCRYSCSSETRGLIDNTYEWGLDDRFTEIRNCNLILEKMEATEAVDDNMKAQYIAEAKMMRAMIYYDLARRGGRFMWVDEVLDTDDDFNIPLTSSITESYSYVLADLRDAIPDLPEEADAGRLNKNAGLALLSEVCLTAAAYTDNSSSLYVSSGTDLYQEAIDAVDEISGVSLDSDYESIFNQDGAYDSDEIILAQYFSSDVNTVSDTEMIYLISNVVNSNVETNGCGPLFSVDDIFECWLTYTPTQNLIDDYLVIDEQTGEAVRWDESSQFVNNTTAISRDEALSLIDHKEDAELVEGEFKAFKVNSDDISISDLMYNNRDLRFDASIVYDGCTFYGEDITMYSYGNMSRWATSKYGSDHVTLTNYCDRKGIYTDMSPRPFYNVYTDYHCVLFRYGRALLNKAEALLRQENIEEAVETFNLTRTIHGGLPESTASTLQEAWDDYKIERRVELYWEGDWYFSLLRWGKYGYEANDGKTPSSVIDELCEPATFIEIKTDRTAAFVGNVQFSNDERTFNVRSYLLPITRSVIQANSAISDSDQNSGWE